MAKFKITIDVSGFNETRRGGAIQSFLNDAGERIAATAQAASGKGGEDFVSRPSPGRTRARTVVITATPRGMVVESKNRILSRSLDGGR